LAICEYWCNEHWLTGVSIVSCLTCFWEDAHEQYHWVIWQFSL
jgi:hypothetical protein